MNRIADVWLSKKTGSKQTKASITITKKLLMRSARNQQTRGVRGKSTMPLPMGINKNSLGQVLNYKTSFCRRRPHFFK